MKRFILNRILNWFIVICLPTVYIILIYWGIKLETELAMSSGDKYISVFVLSLGVITVVGASISELLKSKEKYFSDENKRIENMIRNHEKSIESLKKELNKK